MSYEKNIFRVIFWAIVAASLGLPSHAYAGCINVEGELVCDQTLDEAEDFVGLI